MHACLQPAILGGALAALLVLTQTCAAHFVLIYPDADDDRPVLTADAAWPPLASKRARNGGPSAKTNKAKSVPPSKQKLQSRVTPLKRERPKRETDPPKTRRPELGW